MEQVGRKQLGTKQSRLLVSALPVAILLLIAILAPHIMPQDPYAQHLEAALQEPSWSHWLGTDRYGRDVLSRVLAGAPVTIFSAILLLGAASIGGSLVGIAAGCFGGRTDTVLMRCTDLFLAFPEMVFAIAVAAAFGGGIINAALALALVAWPKYARLTRGLTLTVQKQPYVTIARMNGSNTLAIVKNHIVPNIAGPMLVTAVLDGGSIMMELAGLSFLGLGAMPPQAEWGAMMNNGRSFLQTAPWVILAPGTAIFLTVAAFNILGDSLRDYLDPQVY